VSNRVVILTGKKGSGRKRVTNLMRNRVAAVPGFSIKVNEQHHRSNNFKRKA